MRFFLNPETIHSLKNKCNQYIVIVEWLKISNLTSKHTIPNHTAKKNKDTTKLSDNHVFYQHKNMPNHVQKTADSALNPCSSIHSNQPFKKRQNRSSITRNGFVALRKRII